MPLLKTWAPHFQSAQRTQGRDDQMNGRVERTPAQSGELIRAEVHGAQTHIVNLRNEGGTCVADCDCPTYLTGTNCSHIWATLLDVQAQNMDTSDDATTIILPPPAAPKARKRSGQRQPPQAEPDWIGRLSLLRPLSGVSDHTDAHATLAQRQICYVVDAERSSQHAGLVVELWQRYPTQTGWSRFKPFKIDHEQLARIEDPADRELCALMLGARQFHPVETDRVVTRNRPHGTFRLRPGAQRSLLHKMVVTGRAYVDDGAGTVTSLSWDSQDDSPWILWMVGADLNDGMTIDIEIRRDGQRMGIDKPIVVVGGRDGLIICDGKVAAFDDRDATRWVVQFRDELMVRDDTPSIYVAAGDVQRFLDQLYLLPHLPEIELPAAFNRPQRHVEPTACLELTGNDSEPAPQRRQQLRGRVWFDYEGLNVQPTQPGRFVVNRRDDQAEPSQLIRRDDPFERTALATLAPLGFRANPTDNGQSLLLAVRDMPTAISALTDRGWRVWADQRAVRRSDHTAMSIKTGVDWFELHGGITFNTDRGEQLVALPDILAAAQAGKQMIELDDGSQGLLPAEWLDRHGLLSALGTTEADHLRFQISQVAMLDGLLDEQELVEVDPPFEQARRRLREFERINPLHESDSFHGELRTYQRDGVGWLRFLRWLGAGGILADDMGLGKTVQVLAMLDRRHDPDCPDDEAAPPGKPTLVVAPRSVVFNWMDEAARFAPRLRIQAYTGTERELLREAFGQYDMIVTSYGLMRRDIAELHQYEFDYVVLDEAQMIKNPASQSAKAARLLMAKHRLALTGTPIENHLGDLWSIFEFLNPGMLGTAGRFGAQVRSSLADPRSRDAASQSALALRPFILRRTKRQVMEDLPEKTEQTIVCEMEDPQRQVYDQLLTHYRGRLLGQGELPAAGQSTMMVLEALLRLRQAACHPGLIDPARSDQPSAKLDTLLDQLTELIDEGHKALVFSQFTSLLALVRSRLEQNGIVYEYLDGQTRDRKNRVHRFQTDPHCPVFLISLKAGGLGLNLTAAEYVFILDPWWNPAVEAQAIDRAHRIGQTQHVFAYRLICANTVEQRITELQEKKRKLADAIVGGQGNPLKTLTREDLERLLS